MPTPFRVVVKDDLGKLQTITIEAESRSEAGEAAMLRGWEVVGLEEEISEADERRIAPEDVDYAARRKRERLIARVALYVTNEFEHPQFRVKEILPAVTAQRVYGIGLWSDFKIGLRDAFGGRSQTGEEAIARMIQELREELQVAAVDAGAQIVLGFQFRIEAVGDRGERMFFGTACGSPAKIAAREQAAADRM